jgi:hypothetical protein
MRKTAVKIVFVVAIIAVFIKVLLGRSEKIRGAGDFSLAEDYPLGI